MKSMSKKFIPTLFTLTGMIYGLILCSGMVMAQDGSGEFGIRFSGFVKNDFFYDSRQTVTIREGHFLLYPAARLLDPDKKDINATSAYNFLSIQTRLTGAITAPDAFGAKTSGMIEADFFGNENANFVDNNGFRLRHAFARLKWTNTELLFGQYWHPMFVPACFSEVISFNTGAPFQPFSRNPQMRLTQKINQFRLIGALSAQRDFASPGGSVALRNSPIPDAHFQVHYETKNAESRREFFTGAGIGYKSIQPLTLTEKGTAKYKTDKAVGGIMSTVFMRVSSGDFVFKFQGVYGQNIFDLMMLGGYAVHSVKDTTRNTVTYTPLNTMALWSEGIWNKGSWQLAIWAGYTANQGASKTIHTYSNKVGGTEMTIRGVDIKNIRRVSPRVVWTGGKFSFALETEYTVAAYAKKDQNGNFFRNAKGRVTSSEDVANLRVLFSTILRF